MRRTLPLEGNQDVGAHAAPGASHQASGGLGGGRRKHGSVP